MGVKLAKFVLQLAIGLLVTEKYAEAQTFFDDFNAPLSPTEWVTAFSSGAANVYVANGTLTLETVPNTGCATALARGTRAFSVSNGTIHFTSRVLDAYVDQSIYGDAQPRGMVSGIDRSNAIEFVNAYPVPNTVAVRTVANGVVTETLVNIGQSVRSPAIYEFVATNTQVEFRINGTVVATHATSIPTVPLNVYFSTGDSCAGNVPVVVDWVRVDIPGLCQIPNVPLLKQSGPQATAWSSNRYDNRCTNDSVCRGSSSKYDCGLNPAGNSCTIGQLGCRLTSAAMILSHHGVTVSPAELNTIFSQPIPGAAGCASCYVGYSHGNVKPGAVAAYAASRGITITELGHGRVGELADNICRYGPQVVGINNNGHWMVATGAEDVTASSYLVNDPSGSVSGNRRTWPASGITGVRLHAGPNSPSVNPAAVVIRVYSPVDLLVIDPLGRRLGRDPITGHNYQEIPSSSYELLGINDDAGDIDGDPAKEIDIRVPELGAYRVQVIGTASGNYDLDAYLFDSNGVRQEFNIERVATAQNLMQEYTLAVSATQTPGALLRAEPSTVWPPNGKLVPINASLTLGLRGQEAVTARLASITCDDNCVAARDIVGAQFGTDDRQFELRATRSGSGVGRTYTITYNITNSLGKESSVSTKVVVPHDRR